MIINYVLKNMKNSFLFLIIFSQQLFVNSSIYQIRAHELVCRVWNIWTKINLQLITVMDNFGIFFDNLITNILNVRNYFRYDLFSDKILKKFCQIVMSIMRMSRSYYFHISWILKQRLPYISIKYFSRHLFIDITDQIIEGYE